MAGSMTAMRRATDQLDAANIGYDQSQRWTFFQNGRIVPGMEADCSSICGAIIKLGGYPIDLSGTFYTGNFATRAKAAGFSVKYFTDLSAVKAGDFLLKPKHHVEFAYATNRFFSAHIGGHNMEWGNNAGNLTGKEVGFGNAYNYIPGGWTYICRPPQAAVDPGTPSGAGTPPNSPYHGQPWPGSELHFGPNDYFGLITGPANSHGGYDAAERPYVKMIQQQLIYGGFVPRVTNINSGWADGKFEQPTVDAVTRFQERLRAHSTSLFGQVWSDDWATLFNL
jgi:hypothetical protein